MTAKAKKIVRVAVILALFCAFIAANIVISFNGKALHAFFKNNTVDLDSEHVRAALESSDNAVQDTAEDSMVLLKNNGALPLKGDDVKVNLFGYGATDNGFLTSGGGSGGCNAPADKKITLSRAFETEGISYNKELLAAYSAYCDYDADVNFSSECYLINPPAAFYTAELISRAKEFSDVAVIVLSRFARENAIDRAQEIPFTRQDKLGDGVSEDNTRTMLETSSEEDLMIRTVCENFGTVIVLYNAGNVMETGFLDDERIDAAMYIGQTGQSGALAIPRLLKGYKTVENEDGTKSKTEISPSGKLSDTYAYDLKAYSPTFANATGNGTNNLHYAENIYIGYRWYETADAEGFFDGVDNVYGKGYDGVVQFPFGYGLSYTDFTWEVTQNPDMSTVNETSSFTVKVRVTNNGTYAGKDVVQLYFTPPYYERGIEKAHVNLLDFAKTDILLPGESEEVTLSFSAYDMASYDDYAKSSDGISGWVLEAGTYRLKLMTDAHTSKSGTEDTVFTLSESIRYETDPDTGAEVKNRFTGDTAYAGVPIDGSTVHDEITYLTRADFEGTFPAERTDVPSDEDAVAAAKNYVYHDPDAEGAVFESKKGDLRLVLKEDGSFADIDELTGKKTVKLIYNDALLKQLNDYGSDKWTELIGQLDPKDIKRLIGQGGYNICAVESVGMPYRTFKDGPAGYNKDAIVNDGKGYWTAWPTASLIGCSWNKKTAYVFGRVQGVEGSATGENGWCAPGVNLHRSPFNSRNYEYFSEDPVISGELAKEIIKGAKRGNVYCFIKHWVASEAGSNPLNWNTWLTEQSLRELYMRPFEAAVKEKYANAIMSSFNGIGAVWAGRNGALNQEILRGEWGFRGTMVTDWYTRWYMDYTAGVCGGNDTWLDIGNAVAVIDMSDPYVAYGARRAAKNILYTWVNTYVTAKEFAEYGNDGYETRIDLRVYGTSYSYTFVFVWALIDVVALDCMAAWGVFALATRVKKRGQLKKAKGR